eukprot:scaffold12617_cov138-Skeletonema_marinoi.AAC.3
MQEANDDCKEQEARARPVLMEVNVTLRLLWLQLQLQFCREQNNNNILYVAPALSASNAYVTVSAC